MSLMKKRYAWANVLTVIVLAFIIGAFTVPDIAVSQSTWEWSKENPKPSWWRWDKSYFPTDPVRGGYYRRAAFKYIGLLNPNHWPVHDWVTMSYLYDRLLYADGTHKPNVLWMAESWKFTSSTSAILKLRKGIKFHDGSDFNAASYKYQVEWMMDKKNGAWTRAGLAPVKKVEVVDEYTLKWQFNRPWAGFPGTMQFTQGATISALALKKDGALKEIMKLEKSAKRFKKKLAKYEKKGKTEKAEKTRNQITQIEKKVEQSRKDVKGFIPLDKWAVGCGPYMIEETRPGNYLKLKRNPNWWFGKSIGRPEMPYFDGWKVTVIPDISVQLANLRADKIDAMYVDPSQYKMIKDDPRLDVRVSPQNDMHGLMINHTKKIFQDIRVRKAISHAIDRKALIDGILFGLGREASCMYPSDHWAHNPRLKPVTYDPELSKKLLAQAGYKDGLTLKGYYWNYPLSVSEATAIKAMLKKIGIDWKVEHLELAAATDRMRNLDYDLSVLSITWIWDPDMHASALYHPNGGFNFGRITNKKVAELVMAGRGELDIKKRQMIYHNIEKELYDNYDDVWIRWSMAVEASRKKVQGHNQKMAQQGKEGFWYSHPLWFKDGKP